MLQHTLHRTARRARRGFTMIELIAVVAVIAILVGVAQMNFGETKLDAYERAMESDAKNFMTAQEQHYNRHDRYRGAGVGHRGLAVRHRQLPAHGRRRHPDHRRQSETSTPRTSCTGSSRPAPVRCCTPPPGLARHLHQRHGSGVARRHRLHLPGHLIRSGGSRRRPARRFLAGRCGFGEAGG